jgi:hypothetical protein
MDSRRIYFQFWFDFTQVLAFANEFTTWLPLTYRPSTVTIIEEETSTNNNHKNTTSTNSNNNNNTPVITTPNQMPNNVPFNPTFSLFTFDSPAYTTPSPNYSASSPNYNIPSLNHSAPSSNYAVPSPNFNAPSPNYNSPSHNYGTPSPNFNTSGQLQYKTNSSPTYNPSPNSLYDGGYTYNPNNHQMYNLTTSYSVANPTYINLNINVINTKTPNFVIQQYETTQQNKFFYQSVDNVVTLLDFNNNTLNINITTNNVNTLDTNTITLIDADLNNLPTMSNKNMGINKNDDMWNTFVT